MLVNSGGYLPRRHRYSPPLRQIIVKYTIMAYTAWILHTVYGRFPGGREEVQDAHWEFLYCTLNGCVSRMFWPAYQQTETPKKLGTNFLSQNVNLFPCSLTSNFQVLLHHMKILAFDLQYPKWFQNLKFWPLKGTLSTLKSLGISPLPPPPHPVGTTGRVAGSAWGVYRLDVCPNGPPSQTPSPTPYCDYCINVWYIHIVVECDVIVLRILLSSLTLSLLRVINVKFLLQPQPQYYIA